MGTRLAHLCSILNSIAAPLRELDERAEQELVTLAMNAARLIVRRELKTDPAQVLAAVREAMAGTAAAARMCACICIRRMHCWCAST